MSIYKKMYFTLFNAITDALNLLGKHNTEAAIKVLSDAQIKTEEMYINADGD